jgi:N-acetylated-alpha-linked acidic dipeptidase
VPFLNFTPLDNALARFEESARRFEATAKRFAKGLPGMEQNELNSLLARFERTLTLDSGLPRRPWFKHQVYAPGFYTGYGVKTMPGVREAIEERHWEEAEQQIQVLARTLETAAAHIDKAAEVGK